MVLFPFHTRNQVEIDIEEVSEEQADHAYIKNRTREQHMVDVYYLVTKDYIQP